jgi:hypothetical protein
VNLYIVCHKFIAKFVLVCGCWLSPIHEQELIWLFICVDFI